MVTCRIILGGDLPDLAGRRRDIHRRLPAPTSIRDALEALGIPHGEIGRILLDGAAASLADLVGDGSRVEAWPAVPADLADPRFLCDLHLGKLVRLLRFCGFDTLWEPGLREAALARLAVRDRRTVLSRHRALLKRSAIGSSLLIRSNRPDAQLAEVLQRFRLAGRIRRPGRCATCNGTLVATAKADVPAPIPPRTAAWLDEYWVCAGCGQVFWEGTHVQRLRDRVARIVAAIG
ncbi:MAG TPA: Mut7-C RNAse domain-containing protein [Candidatus Krumholzibacteria bacterium]|nr:Mut7-C RNAse domain-containing protein [Candidatus Krumholzibacteria bacterium]HPD71854.1 Mut7-C RNAse domain-containing protein [Candidatus Krumholzibacteria bacterium]HRY41213.1 Mut7-C RNAse domain-containing protein [Candidatus Krumholzibacteria bacterium]